MSLTRSNAVSVIPIKIPKLINNRGPTILLNDFGYNLISGKKIFAAPIIASGLIPLIKSKPTTNASLIHNAQYY